MPQATNGVNRFDDVAGLGFLSSTRVYQFVPLYIVPAIRDRWTFHLQIDRVLHPLYRVLDHRFPAIGVREESPEGEVDYRTDHGRCPKIFGPRSTSGVHCVGARGVKREDTLAVAANPKGRCIVVSQAALSNTDHM